MARRLARILTALALVVGFGAGISSGPAGASTSDPQVQYTQISSADWWW